jgi:hypothetical protein
MQTYAYGLKQCLCVRRMNICNMYRENFCFVHRFHGSTLHGDRFTAGCEAHTNFADESACLKADNFRNEVVTIHRS